MSKRPRITLATIRVLCENRVVAAETTPGGHWRVPSSEVERLKRDGLPADSASHGARSQRLQQSCAGFSCGRHPAALRIRARPLLIPVSRRNRLIF